MSTIEQLAGGSQTQQVSTNVGTAQSYQAAQQVPGESLAKDLMGIIKPAAGITQEYQTASVKAAQRSAMDKKTELARFIADQESKITPDTDLREVQENISTFYATQTQTVFDNEDAQNMFDTMYTKEVGTSVAQMNAKYEVQALKNDAVVNRVNNLDGISAQLQAGIPIPKAQIDEHVDSITAGGYFTKEQAYEDIAYAMNTSLNEKYKINKNLPIYNADGTINPEMQRDVFNAQYDSVVQMDENGAVTAIGDTTDKARIDIISNWNTLKVTHKSNEDNFNARFESLKKSMSKSTSNNNGSYVGSNDIATMRNTFREDVININSEKPLTKQQVQDYTEFDDELTNQERMSKFIESDLLNGDIDKLREYMRDGRLVDLPDAHRQGEIKPFKLTAAKYDALVNKVLESQSSQLLAMDVDAQNEGQYKAGLAQLDRWEQISGKKSAFTVKQEKIFDDNSLPIISNGKELRQALAYHKSKESNPAYDADNKYISRLEELLGKTYDGKPLTDLQFAREANSIVTIEKRNRQERLSSAELAKSAETAMQNIAQGEGWWGETFTFEADMAGGSDIAAKQWVNANQKWGTAVDSMSSLETVDYGNTFTGVDQRVFVPTGVKPGKFKGALDTIRKNYNKERKADLDKNDVILETVFDKGTNNFATTMRVKSNDEWIGTLDVTSTYLTSSKENIDGRPDTGRNNRRSTRR